MYFWFMIVYVAALAVAFVCIFVILVKCRRMDSYWPFGRKERKMKKTNTDRLVEASREMAQERAAEIATDHALTGITERLKALEASAEEAKLVIRRAKIDPLIKAAMHETASHSMGYLFSAVLDQQFGAPSPSCLDCEKDIIFAERVQKMLDAGLLRMVKPKVKKAKK